MYIAWTDGIDKLRSTTFQTHAESCKVSERSFSSLNRRNIHVCTCPIWVERECRGCSPAGRVSTNILHKFFCSACWNNWKQQPKIKLKFKFVWEGLLGKLCVYVWVVLCSYGEFWIVQFLHVPRSGSVVGPPLKRPHTNTLRRVALHQQTHTHTIWKILATIICCCQYTHTHTTDWPSW